MVLVRQSICMWMSIKILFNISLLILSVRLFDAQYVWIRYFPINYVPDKSFNGKSGKLATGFCGAPGNQRVLKVLLRFSIMSNMMHIDV